MIESSPKGVENTVGKAIRSLALKKKMPLWHWQLCTGSETRGSSNHSVKLESQNAARFNHKTTPNPLPPSPPPPPPPRRHTHTLLTHTKIGTLSLQCKNYVNEYQPV